MTINNQMIKILETYTFNRPFPTELKRFLKDRYSEEPWPYEYSEQDLYANIKEDAYAYFAGNLDVAIKTPLDKKELEIEYLRDLYGDAMCEINDLQKYIEELHELLWAHGLESSRMLHSDSHVGAYAEANANSL